MALGKPLAIFAIGCLLVVIALGVGFLGETLAPLQVLGASLVLTGVLLAQIATPAESRPTLPEEV